MNRLCLAICVLLVAFAAGSHHNRNRGNAGPNSNTNSNSNANSLDNYADPSNWVSVQDIERLPSLNEVTLKRLESQTVDEGATLVDQLYHLAQVNRVLKPVYSPERSQIPGFFISQRGQRVDFKLNEFVEVAKHHPGFGNDEVTIYINGMPETWPAVEKATDKMVEAYVQRYNLRPYAHAYPNAESNNKYEGGPKTSSEENEYNYEPDNEKSAQNAGNIVVINLGEAIRDFEHYATLDIEEVGNNIGDTIVDLTNQADVPQEIIHVIGHGVGAHVAGVAGRQYSRRTGHKLRRITGLDPSRIFAKAAYTLNGLARGDADFVDVIHTSAYGLGTPERSGDVDFYPNGPDTGVPGADNVVEASVRAVRYFAESVRPGNERNFPAVAATSFDEYKENNGYGRRAYMGIDTSYDVEGDYMLQVNPKSPFGRSAPAQQQNYEHGQHQQWQQGQEYGKGQQQQRQQRQQSRQYQNQNQNQNQHQHQYQRNSN